LLGSTVLRVYSLYDGLNFLPKMRLVDKEELEPIQVGVSAGNPHRVE
jgi:hypothetical protein